MTKPTITSEIGRDRANNLLNLVDCLIERINDDVTIGDAEQLSDLTGALSNLVDCLR